MESKIASYKREGVLVDRGSVIARLILGNLGPISDG